MVTTGMPQSPRAWAALFVSAKSAEKRAAIWKRVPQEWKPLVRSHAQIWRDRNGPAN